MTEEKFNTLKKLQGSKFTNAEKAKMVGLQPQSIKQYDRFSTWDEYCAYKANLCAKQAAKKGSAGVEQLKMDIYQTSTLDMVIEKMQQLHEDLVDLHLGVMKLIGWEERKQAQKEEYWAKQREQKRSYFNRWNNEQ